jgi:hypothetical protein
MMELLVVKCGNDYLRFTDPTYTLCQMSRASVFPLGEVAEVRGRVAALNQDGMACRLMKLVISEEPFDGEREE